MDALQKIPAQVNVPKIHVFLDLANYYRQFVKNFSFIAKPLTNLTSKDQLCIWGRNQQQAFETLKQNLGTALVLRRLDVSKSFQLQMDWSSFGLEVVLTQKDDFSREYVVAYASHSNNTGEANCSSYEREALVVVWVVAHFLSQSLLAPLIIMPIFISSKDYEH